ncbi:copper homeostasis membrane protein CopD [Erwinia psidii]|uniref:Copper resistance protein D n=1 Tax=Erwinia psidii TaxID=69224 RepID=A0A3N6S0Y2_9GAMM|nr:copper homeostasis membrane protein CopD [Erwinia psidii]MCX8956205.1 copper resistance D family protein [Erwinia psidii]RQM39208.1 copper resistance D family protein [Erwinia psidii]
MSFSLFYMLCRWLYFLALMSLTGCSVFSAVLAPVRFRRYLRQKLHPLLVASAIAVLLSIIMLFAGQTALLAERWQDLQHLSLWKAVLQTHVGRVWQWQLIAAVTGVLALFARDRDRPTVWLLSGVAQLIALGFTGHAAMSDGMTGVIHRTSQVIHLMSAAFWGGGLIPVLLLMHTARQPDTRYDALKTLMCYSRYGHLAVALVLLTGILNALLILGWPPSGFHLYTQLLLLKTSLVGGMCLAALFNRYVLVPRFQHRGDSVRYVFILTTLAEILLAALVVLLVSVFATLEPA